MTSDYKKYSLEKLQEWVHDAMNSDASPHEIYSAIREAVREDYYYHKDCISRADELLALLKSNDKGHLSCDKDDPSPECQKSWNDFWEEHYYPEEYQGSSVSSVNLQREIESIRESGGYEWTPEVKKDKVKKWVLPVEECKDADTDETEYFISFPDDLLEAANLKEGDLIEWVDQGDGSYLLEKHTERFRF
jgi:hypothetical protein